MASTVSVNTEDAEVLYHFGRAKLLASVPVVERRNFYFDQECGMRKADAQVYDALQRLHSALMEAGV